MKDDLIHLTYVSPPEGSRDPKFPHGRDSGAFCDLRGPAETLGYEWGYEFLLHIFRGPKSGDLLRDKKEYFENIRPNDCLVMCTRPPLSDKAAVKRRRMRRSMHRSHCYLEKVIFKVVKEYISKCNRTTVVLNPDFVANRVESQGENVTAPPAFFTFGNYGNGRLNAMSRTDGSGEAPGHSYSRYSSIGFFLHIGALPEFGCRLILAWGMGGAETAAWCRIIGRNFSHWFEQPRFAVARMDFVDVPEQPQSIRYSDKAGVEVLLDHVIDEQPPSSSTAKSSVPNTPVDEGRATRLPKSKDGKEAKEQGRSSRRRSA